MTSPKTIVLVTGGNGGIGFDTCAAFASKAKYHVFMGSRSLEKGHKALSDLQARHLPGGISLVQLDVTNPESISQSLDTITKEFGKLDILVNNAGIVSTADSIGTQLQETLATNSIGPAVVTEACLPLLKKSSAPRIIYVTSGLGSIEHRINPPTPVDDIDWMSYRTSKAALNMIAVCHYKLFKEWGCKVWTYCPGFVATNLTGEANRENRKKMGAGSSEGSAAGILEIAEGGRDADVGGFVHRDGTYPW